MRIQIIIFITVFLLVGNAKANINKTVLLLHSYNKELFWTDNLNASIVSELQKTDKYTTDIRIEYMDTKRFEDSAYLSSFKKFLFVKYKDTQFDLIISTDNAAFEFLKEYKQELSQQAPVVFCGLNNVKVFPQGYTGIIEDVDFSANISLIQKLHPDFDKIYIAIDNSITGKALRKQLLAVIGNEFPSLSHEFLTDYSFTEFKSKLTTFEKGDILLLVTFNYDNNGLTIPYDRILDEIKPFCDVPIYGTWDFYLNKGIVGGKITSAKYHGKQAGKIANLILSGESPEAIEIKAGPTTFMFDYNYVKKHHIDKYQLPKNAIILNKPENIIRKNKPLFALILFVIVLLVITVILLSVLFSRKKKALLIERNYIDVINSKQDSLKEALTESKKAYSLQRAFLANLSHEIRTPMNGILGFSNLLNEVDSTDDQAKLYLNHITSNSQQLLTIIDDILEISRIETNKAIKETYVVNLNELIENVIKEVNDKRSNLLHINTNYSLQNEEANLLTDGTKLKIILRNLVDNAIKFTSSGEVTIGYSIKNNEIVFAISDTGIGIREEDYDLIFSRFGQVEKGISRNYGGTGLGLSISKAYTELLGGKIWVESTLKKGSTFFFTHSAKFEKYNHSEYISPKAKKFNWPDKTILIAEDEEINFMFFEAVLAATGIKILHAQNGNEAVELFRNNANIDLILMDIKMPDMDGFEASELIKKEKPDIEIIVQTAHTVTFDTEKAKSLGLKYTIHKPIDKNELLNLMASILN